MIVYIVMAGEPCEGGSVVLVTSDQREAEKLVALERAKPDTWEWWEVSEHWVELP